MPRARDETRSDADAESRRTRGRRRSEASKRAILAAASAVLAEHGLRGMTIELVARRAGVSKATIYRWWPSAQMLALDAHVVERMASPDYLPDTGSLKEDLHLRLRAFVRQMAENRFGETFGELVGEIQRDPDLARQFSERVQAPGRREVVKIFQRAIARGEIAPDLELELVADLYHGPLILRLLLGRNACPGGTPGLTEEFADEVVEMVSRAVIRGGRAP